MPVALTPSCTDIALGSPSTKHLQRPSSSSTDISHICSRLNALFFISWWDCCQQCCSTGCGEVVFSSGHHGKRVRQLEVAVTQGQTMHKYPIKCHASSPAHRQLQQVTECCKTVERVYNPACSECFLEQLLWLMPLDSPNESFIPRAGGWGWEGRSVRQPVHTICHATTTSAHWVVEVVRAL